MELFVALLDMCIRCEEHQNSASNILTQLSQEVAEVTETLEHVLILEIEFKRVSTEIIFDYGGKYLLIINEMLID